MKIGNFQNSKLSNIKLGVTLVIILSTTRIFFNHYTTSSYVDDDQVTIVSKILDDQEEEFSRNIQQQKAQVEQQLNLKAQTLMELPLRYYVYDHPNINMKTTINDLRAIGVSRVKHIHDIEHDEQIIAALESSPFRTFNVDAADFFLPPIPFGKIWTSHDHEQVVHEVFHALLNHPIFRSHTGNRHFFIATIFSIFKGSTKQVTHFGNYYDKLYNGTVVQSFDSCALYNKLHNDVTWAGDFNDAFQKEIPTMKRSASIGLGSSNSFLNLVLATTAKFYNSSNFIFYHTRTKASIYNSTIYRYAPVTNITLDKSFPKSSIGFDIKKDEWEREFKDSKFCAVIRGDSPHSHSLLRSIRVGCIPVIFSDTLPVFAPLFKSTLNLTDFAVIIKEEELLKDARNAFLQLNKISREEIEIKIQHLAFAQRVVFTDHQESLFVPALLKEVEMATEVKWN